MGNGASRPCTPHEVLGIEPGATLQETKKAYCRLCYAHQGDPDTLLRLNDAYAACRTHVPFEIYTPALFDTQFARYAPDLFSRLELSYNLHPRCSFHDGDFCGFYRYWGTFRHEDEAVERRVRAAVRMVKARDPRFIRPAAAEAPAYQRPRSPQQKASHVKTWKMLCRACKKGFNSENTLRDHLRSRQHRERAGGGEDVVVRSGGPVETPETGGAADSAAADSAEDGAEGRAGRSETVCRGMPERRSADRGVAREHEAFRTCFHCKKVLESRGRLILHIRESHQ